jgi:hypothetical protein
MTAAIALEELLVWNQESSDFWKAHLEANPALLELPCGIGRNADVQAFVRHIWGAELGNRDQSSETSAILIRAFSLWL